MSNELSRINGLRAILKETLKDAGVYCLFMRRAARGDKDATPANEPTPIPKARIELIEKEIAVINRSLPLSEITDSHLYENLATFMQKWEDNAPKYIPKDKSPAGLADYYEGMSCWVDKTNMYLTYLEGRFNH